MDNPEILASLGAQDSGRNHQNSTQTTKRISNSDLTKNCGWM